MSVRLFSQQEIANLGRELKARTYVKDRIIYSEAYKKDRLLRMQFDKESNLRNDEQIEKTIDRLLWYSWQANQLAFLLQYPDARDEVNMGEWDDSIIGELPNRKTLDVLHDLSNLRYNLYTNDGNYFLGEIWHDLLDGVIITLKDEIVRLYEQQTEDHSGMIIFRD